MKNILKIYEKSKKNYIFFFSFNYEFKKNDKSVKNMKIIILILIILKFLNYKIYLLNIIIINF